MVIFKYKMENNSSCSLKRSEHALCYTLVIFLQMGFRVCELQTPLLLIQKKLTKKMSA